jgi:hypothetical protein
MKTTILASALLLLFSFNAHADSQGGAKLWYRCTLTQADGQWAIVNYPLVLDLYYGKTLEKDKHGFAIHWEGSLAMQFRDGRVRLHPVDYTTPPVGTRFNDQFPEIRLQAKSQDPAFEFVERCDPETGWHRAYELTYTQDKGTYDCKLVEPIRFPPH